MEFMVNGKIPVVENTAAESSAEDPETGLGMTEWNNNIQGPKILAFKELCL